MSSGVPLRAFTICSPDAGRFLEDVLAGLSRPQKALPPKYFYDERGSALFEAICELPEYYPDAHRARDACARHARDMAQRLGPQCALIEYGSGSGRKTRILHRGARAGRLRRHRHRRRAIAGRRRPGSRRDFPGLAVIAVCADYSRPLVLPELNGVSARRRVVYFPGSTIGNFTRARGARFPAQRARGGRARAAGMLVGVDLKKDPARLHAAYNDAQGVTARVQPEPARAHQSRARRRLRPARVPSRARSTTPPLGRIEMHLVSRARAAGDRRAAAPFASRRGETIHTENSYKYSIEEFQALARGAGFEPETCWTDPQRLFSVHYLTVPQPGARAPA